MNKKKHLLKTENLDLIKNDYYNNENNYLLSKYNCCDETLRKFLRNNNVKQKKSIQYTINENFFEKIDSEEKAYFLGFICADGCIGDKRLSFCLNIIDIDVLYKFKDIIKTTAPVSSITYTDKRNNTKINSSGIQIYSKQMINDLNLLGVTKNKSRCLNLPIIPDDLFKHFLRGLFDGDGHVSSQCSLISTQECLLSITKILKKNNININDFIETIDKEKNVYKIFIGKDRIKFLDFIYKNSNIFLKRKYYAYTNEINKHNNEIINSNIQYSILIVSENKILNSLKECAEYLNINYCSFTRKLKQNNYSGVYEKYEKFLVQTKRNGKKIYAKINI